MRNEQNRLVPSLELGELVETLVREPLVAHGEDFIDEHLNAWCRDRTGDEVVAAVFDPQAATVEPRSTEAWDRFGSWLSRSYSIDASADRLQHIRALGLKHSLVFLPNHRSYLDPLVLRWVLEQYGFPPNNTLGGANLALWPFSEIGRRNGIVFIRREFRDDHVYRAVLKTYLSHLMEQRHNLEWYIEGGRTRTGKLRPPRYGILSYVIDAFAVDQQVASGGRVQARNHAQQGGLAAA